VVTNPALPASVQAFNGKIGAKVRQVAPTIFANYKFGDKSSALRPFVGVGLNFTTFDKADSTADGNAINGGVTNISLKDSFGLAAQAGLNYRIDDKWSVGGAIATARVKTKMTTNTLGIIRSADIKFSPIALTFSVGYSF
jgi:outer membrane protein